MEYAKENSVQDAVEFWDVSKSLVSKWGKQSRISETAIGDSSGRKRRGINGSKIKHIEIEDFAAKLITQQRSKGKSIPAKELQRKTSIYANLLDIDFKCSNGWVEKFIKRHDLSTRTKTSCQQKIPEDFIEKIKEFQKNFVETITRVGIIDKRRILNMDETPVCFDMPHKTTLEKKVQKL